MPPSPQQNFPTVSEVPEITSRPPANDPVFNNEISDNEKIKLFERRKAIEWQLNNREPSVQDTYRAALAEVQKEIQLHGIEESEYQAYLNARKTHLH